MGHLVPVDGEKKKNERKKERKGEQRDVEATRCGGQGRQGVSKLSLSWSGRLIRGKRGELVAKERGGRKERKKERKKEGRRGVVRGGRGEGEEEDDEEEEEGEHREACTEE